MNMNVSKTNTGKLLAAVLVLAMVFAGATVLISDESVAATTGGTQSWGGEDLATSQGFEGANILVDKNTTITTGGILNISNGNFTVAEGVTLLVQNGGQINVTGGLVTINGTVTVSGDNNGTPSAFNITSSAASDYDKSGVIVNGTLNVTRGGSITATGTDPSALVNGTLNVTSSGSRISTITGIDIDVAVGGTFRFDGRSSDIDPMTVSSYGPANIANKTTSSVIITAADDITGAGNKTSDLTFTTTSSTFAAYKSDNSSVQAREYALNVNGDVDGLDEISFMKGDALTDYYVSKDAAKSATHAYNDAVVGKTIVGELNVRAGSIVDIQSGAYVIVATSMDVRPTVAEDAETPTANQIISGTLELRGTLSADFRSLDKSVFSNAGTRGTLAINGGSAVLSDFDGTDTVALFGAYWVDDDDNVHIESLASALTNASTAGVDDVTVVGTTEFTKGTAVRGDYVVDSNIDLPENMNLEIVWGLEISEGAIMTIPSSASVIFNGGIYVEGKLVDYDTISESQATTSIDFEVRSEQETGTDIINTYTTFATALAETESGTIYLYSAIEIDRNMNIGPNVTVQYADGTTGNITFKADTNYTLTVDGELYLSSGHNLDTTGGTVVVNNTIRYASGANVGALEDSTYNLDIDGAYYTAALETDDDTSYNYITTAAIAAENSASMVDATIVIYGNVAMGDVTFTVGEDASTLTIRPYTPDENDVVTGNITLVNGASIYGFDGYFTGNVTMDTTAGTTTVSFEKSSAMNVVLLSEETAEGTVTTMGINSTNQTDSHLGTIKGIMTVVSGTVEINDVTQTERVVVNQGATLNINAQFLAQGNAGYRFNTVSDDLPLFTEEFIDDVAGLVVSGTVVIDDGANVQAYIAHVSGTVTVTEGSYYAYLSCNDGTITAEDNGAIQLAIALLNGTVSGKAVFEAVLAFPGSDITGAEVKTPSNTDALTTVIHINGSEYATFYAKDGVSVMSLLLSTDIPGVKIDSAIFYSDEAMRNDFADYADASAALNNVVDKVQAITNGASLSNVVSAVNALAGLGYPVGTYTDVYIGMEPADVAGTITVYQGMKIYIDGLSIDNLRPSQDGNNYLLSVGTHTFTVQVQPGYTGTTQVTLNGTPVTGDSFEITGDMTEFQIVVTGEIAYDSGSTGGDGMGLTEILLVILVILIVVMAIMVALRLMRS